MSSWSRLLLWLLVPGTFVLARGLRLRGWIFFGLWLSLMAAYFIWIGTAWSSLKSETSAVAIPFSWMRTR